jgi:amidophosphoribosyltransferase
MIVQKILHRLLPETAKIRVFGSRATGKARAASDLDLAVDAGRALTLHEIGRLTEAFDEAPLPYKVDVVDLQTISSEFRKLVERDCIAWDYFS